MSTHTTPAIEKAARAIVEQEGILDWDTLGENLRDYPRDLARAALAAALDADEIAQMIRTALLGDQAS